MTLGLTVRSKITLKSKENKGSINCRRISQIWILLLQKGMSKGKKTKDLTNLALLSKRVSIALMRKRVLWTALQEIVLDFMNYI